MKPTAFTWIVVQPADFPVSTLAPNFPFSFFPSTAHMAPMPMPRTQVCASPPPHLMCHPNLAAALIRCKGFQVAKPPLFVRLLDGLKWAVLRMLGGSVQNVVFQMVWSASLQRTLMQLRHPQASHPWWCWNQGPTRVAKPMLVKKWKPSDIQLQPPCPSPQAGCLSPRSKIANAHICVPWLLLGGLVQLKGLTQQVGSLPHALHIQILQAGMNQRINECTNPEHAKAQRASHHLVGDTNAWSKLIHTSFAEDTSSNLNCWNGSLPYIHWELWTKTSGLLLLILV